MAMQLDTSPGSAYTAAAGPQDLLYIIPQLVLPLLMTSSRVQTQSDQKGGWAGMEEHLIGQVWLTHLPHLQPGAGEREYLVYLVAAVGN